VTEAQLLAQPPADGLVGDALLPSGAPDSAELFRGVIEGMRCGILTIDREGRLLMLNEPARLILELQEAPRAGTRIEDALRAHPQLARVLRESFTMSSLPNRAEIELQSEDGPGKTIGFTVSLVRKRSEEPLGAAVFFKDLTHVEHKEEQDRLRDRLAALGQMAANLAHEIRNPLAAIEVSCSLLKRRLPPDAGGRDLLDKIIGEVRRLNRTITSSLEFVRPLSLALAPSDIGPVLEEALVTAQGRRGRAGIRIERRYEAAAIPFLMDRGQLRQVFENLFLNAMEAMGEAGVLRVETSITRAPAAPTIPYRPEGSERPEAADSFDRFLVIRVRDTGAGIAEEHLDKLFYPFFTTKKQGSGVGLSMARKIIDSHHGLIDVESRPGAGAEFIVRLPMIGTVEQGSAP
jgi:signal transduction histidine kinase